MRRPVGVKSVLSFFGSTKLFSRRAATVATFPSARFDERRFRSVQVGCSCFSRCCHLFIDLPFILWEWKLGQAINAVTGTRRLGFSLLGCFFMLLPA
jgi:hypothetical protein